MSGTLLRHECGDTFIANDSKGKEAFHSVKRVQESSHPCDWEVLTWGIVTWLLRFSDENVQTL